MCFYCGNTEIKTGISTNTNWWKGDPTCGGIAENYQSKKDK
jgi:hypothetical protein